MANPRQSGNFLHRTCGLAARVFVLATLFLPGVLLREAAAYLVEPGSQGNEVRLQIDDRSRTSDTIVIQAEIVSAPTWILPAPVIVSMGRVPEVVTTFAVSDVPVGESGILIVRLLGTSLSGDLVFEQFRSIPLHVADAAESIQRAFAIDECCLTVASVDDWDALPEGPILVGVTPNPVVSLANVVFGLPEGGGRAELRVYDVQGRTVEQIQTPHLAGGYHKIAWDGTDNHGRDVGPGVYFYRLSVGSWSETKKLQLLK